MRHDYYECDHCGKEADKLGELDPLSGRNWIQMTHLYIYLTEVPHDLGEREFCSFNCLEKFGNLFIESHSK